MKYFIYGIILLLILLVFLPIVSFAQRQADVWCFGSWASVDFKSGSPEVVTGPFHAPRGEAVMSDSLSNFLFASNGLTIVNDNFTVMSNGNDLIGNDGGSQAELIIQKPGSDNKYFLFTAGYVQGSFSLLGLYYSIIDMSLDNGHGGVTEEKNILLTDAWDAIDKIVAVKHKNKQDIWVITRKFQQDGYASFRITKDGINTNMVFSPSIDRPNNHVQGNIKISPDKKWLVSAYFGGDKAVDQPDFEICSFNSETGEITLKYIIRFQYLQGHYDEPWGVEFSPDSRFLYLSVLSSTNNYTELYQLDVQYINDSAQFFNSRVKIADGPCLGLQLATDGKIYTTGPDGSFYYDYLSVINRPWEKGAACQYEADAVYLDFDDQNRQVGNFLPNILVDYLYRFGWDGRCSSQAFTFKPNFNPVPTYIRWSFSDPGAGADSISYELYPTHYFSHPGEFEVKVTVSYPDGRLEKTSRAVTVEPSPQPDLGPDTVKCEIGEITLNAGSEDGVYVWSTGDFGFNKNEIAVSDTGWYSVQVTNDISCPGFDSIYVGLYPPAEFVEDGLDIVPTSCGGSSGQILGLQVEGAGPFAFEWRDADGNVVGSSLDAGLLGVGNYFLHVYDANGCETASPAYTVSDAGDILVPDVLFTNAHCGQDTASITITAWPNPGDLLYSIDNGNSWQAGDGFFDSLAAGSYFVRAKDASGCEGVYNSNPVVVADIPGPVVDAVSLTDEIDNLANGAIDISATVSSGTAYFSIDDGISLQVGDGLFQNLGAGTYPCLVRDGFGCDTSFVAEVQRVSSQVIEALAGNGSTCIGNAAVVPLKVSGFGNIYKFNLKLTYDTSLLVCTAYINANADLENGLTVSILPSTDEININWLGDTVLTLDDNSTLLELVFNARADGMSGIDWAAEEGGSAFYDQGLEQVNAIYVFGSLRVYTRPEISMPPPADACENDTLLVFPVVEGGSGELGFLWEGPDGQSYPYRMLILQGMAPDQSGTYSLTVTDSADCVEQANMEITVSPLPLPDFAGRDTIFAEPGFVLDAGGGFRYYDWSTGDSASFISVYEEGLYSVDITSFPGCKSSSSVRVLWGGVPFRLPSAFSPNGDGLNDVFKPLRKYDLVKTYHLMIFDRWGQQVFGTEDIEEGWDGSSQGSPSPAGTYVYRIIYTSASTGGRAQTEAGQVLLVR